MSDKTPGIKTSIYLPRDARAELVAEAERLDRSVSWLLCRAWRSYRAAAGSLPGVPPVGHEGP